MDNRQPRSFQSSIRMTPEVKEALESIAAELSAAGPYPRPWSVAGVMALALERLIAEHAARKAAEVKAPKPKASKAAPKASPKASPKPKAPKAKPAAKATEAAPEVAQ